MKTLTSSLQTLETSTLDTLLEGSPLPVLVDFWAPWCGPCKAMTPVLEDLAKALEGRVLFGKLNIDEAPEVAARFGIQAIPSLLLFQKGKVLDRFVGARSRPELERLLSQHLA